MVNHTSRHFFSSGYIGAALLIGASALILGTGSNTRENEAGTAHVSPQQLIREVVANELQAQQTDTSAWRFKRVTQQQGETDVYEVLDTADGPIHRLIARNGAPLDAAERRTEDARIDHLIADPSELQKHVQEQQKDVEEERRLVEMLPEAFNYRYAGRDGNLVKLSFVPNPDFHPQHREGDVFHNMTGTVWVDPSQKRIARIEGRLIDEVKFGDGILGYLAKGGTFVVEQRDLGDGRWELTRLDVNMNGKVLFFKTIGVHQNESDSDFQPLAQAVPLQSAADMLEQRHVSESSPAPVQGPSVSGDKVLRDKVAQPSSPAVDEKVVFPKNMRNFA